MSGDDGKDDGIQLIKKAKTAQTLATIALTRKRNAVKLLMVGLDNLHLVKDGLDEVTAAYSTYLDAHYHHLHMLSDREEDVQQEIQRHAQKQTDHESFLDKAGTWIKGAEASLADQLDKRSEDGGSGSSSWRSGSRCSAVSIMSAHAKEQARLAELLIEKSMLQKKHALQQALQQEVENHRHEEEVLRHKQRQEEEELRQKRRQEEEELRRKRREVEEKLRQEEDQLRLLTEIAKSEAREQVFAEFSGHQMLNVCDSMDQIKPGYPSNCDLQLPTYDGMNANGTAKLNPNSFEASKPQEAKTQPLGASWLPEPGACIANDSTKLNPNAYPFTTPTHSEPPKSNVSPIELQRMTSLQEAHRELVATSKQIAAAMLLPTPEVPKFEGNPLDYRPFVIAFNARIASRALGDADKLYYLDQHLMGDAKETIAGCVHLEAEFGYKEAWRLLEKEYGDAYLVSVAYLQKLLRWSDVKFDDCVGLKRLAAFLNKCNNAMRSYSDLSVLDHLPNMQTIVQKLPPYLQNKWRDNVMKLRSQGHSQTGFADLLKFVEQASDAANDPVYGRDALRGGRPTAGGFHASNERSNNKINTAVNSFSTNTESQDDGTSAGWPCPVCSSFHDIETCDIFRGKNLEDRRAFVQQNNLCFACYGKFHLARFCRSRRTCSKCNRAHPTLLHDDNFQTVNVQQVTVSEQSVPEQSSYDTGGRCVDQYM